MKILTTILLFALATSAMAAGTESAANANRLVADDLEIATLPNGAVVQRLVSRGGTTAGQFWVHSVYGHRESILVFQDGSGILQGATSTQLGHKGERRKREIERIPKERVDVVTQAAECK